MGELSSARRLHGGARRLRRIVQCLGLCEITRWWWWRRWRWWRGPAVAHLGGGELWQRGAVQGDATLRPLLHANAHDVGEIGRWPATVARRTRVHRSRRWPALRRRRAPTRGAMLCRRLAVLRRLPGLRISLWRRLAVALLRVGLLAGRRLAVRRWLMSVGRRLLWVLLAVELPSPQAQQRRARTSLTMSVDGGQSEPSPDEPPPAHATVVSHRRGASCKVRHAGGTRQSR